MEWIKYEAFMKHDRIHVDGFGVHATSIILQQKLFELVENVNRRNSLGHKDRLNSYTELHKLVKDIGRPSMFTADTNEYKEHLYLIALKCLIEISAEATREGKI